MCVVFKLNFLLFKLIPRTNSESDRNKCIDEATRNNQIQWTECSKVIGRFSLKNQIYFDISKKQKEADSAKSPSEPSLSINRLAGHHNTHSDYFICSDDDQVFQQTLDYSLNFNSYMSAPGNDSLNTMDLHNNLTVGYFEFDSGLLPQAFDLNNLLMLYYEIPPDLPYKNANHSLIITFSVLVAVFFALFVLLSAVNFFFLISKSNYGKLSGIFSGRLSELLNK